MGPGNAVAEPESRRARRRRHGRGRTVEQVEPSEVEGPNIVDPAARNLVSDQMRSSEQSGDEGAGEQTSVISPDELAAYFARLAQESAPEAESSETESSEVGENDDAKEGE